MQNSANNIPILKKLPKRSNDQRTTPRARATGHYKVLFEIALPYMHFEPNERIHFCTNSSAKAAGNSTAICQLNKTARLQSAKNATCSKQHA